MHTFYQVEERGSKHEVSLALETDMSFLTQSRRQLTEQVSRLPFIDKVKLMKGCLDLGSASFVEDSVFLAFLQALKWKYRVDLRYGWLILTLELAWSPQKSLWPKLSLKPQISDTSYYHGDHQLS